METLKPQAVEAKESLPGDDAELLARQPQKTEGTPAKRIMEPTGEINRVIKQRYLGSTVVAPLDPTRPSKSFYRNDLSDASPVIRRRIA